LFLFVRSVFFRRTTRINDGLKEFEEAGQLGSHDLSVLVACVVAFAAGKLAWTWWTSL
jgi:hypothetical protein